MHVPFLRSARFWIVFAVSAVLLGLFFAWELNILQLSFLPWLPRPFATRTEKIFTSIMIFFIALDAGILSWSFKKGYCPIGAKRATVFTGTLGFVTLLCPVCLIIPFGFFGLTLSLTFLLPYVPLLRSIVLFLLIATTVIVWPKQTKPKKKK